MKRLILALFLLLISCQKEDNSALIEQQQTQIQNYLNQVNELKSEINSLTSLLSSLQNQVSSLENSNSELNSQVSSQNIELQELNESLNSINLSYEDLQASYDNLLSNYTDLELTNQSLNEQILALQEQIESLSTTEETTTEETTTEETTTEETTTYQVTIAISGNGSTSISSGTYNQGQQISITASSEIGNRFINWSGDVSSTEETISITVNSNMNISANFDAIQYTLTVNSGTGGTVSSSGGTFNYGDTVTITASSNTGYYFNNWSGGLSSNDSEITVTVTSDLSLSANFTERQTVSVQVNNDNGGVLNYTGNFGSTGSVSSNTNQSITLYENETITFSVTFNLGYYLDSWGGDLSGNESSKSVTIDSNFDIISTEYDEYSAYGVTIQLQQGGSVEWTSRNFNGTTTAGQTQLVNNYYPNEQLTFKAIPNTGYTFIEWDCQSGCEGNTFGSEETLTITMPQSSINIIAKFQ